MIVTLVGVWLANEVVHLLQVDPYRWRCRAAWAASWAPPRRRRSSLSPTPAPPAADSRCSELGKTPANRRALATALPPLVDSVSSAHRSVMEALGLARRGGVSCPPGVHSDFASPQSAQPAEQLATTIRQLRGARIQGVTDLHCKQFIDGGVAQMVERSLSMREVRGSIPRTSK